MFKQPLKIFLLIFFYFHMYIFIYLSVCFELKKIRKKIFSFILNLMIKMNPIIRIKNYIFKNKNGNYTLKNSQPVNHQIFSIKLKKSR